MEVVALEELAVPEANASVVVGVNTLLVLESTAIVVVEGRDKLGVALEETVVSDELIDELLDMLVMLVVPSIIELTVLEAGA